MKRWLFICFSVLLIAGLLLTSCGGTSSTTTTSTPPTSSTSSTGTTSTTKTTTTTSTTQTSTQTTPTTTASTPSVSTPAVPRPTGGVLKAIVTGGPAMMSYRGLMGPADATYTFPAGEYLVEPYVDDQGNRGWIPFLCESYTIDKTANTFTFKLRKGIKFTDGSDLTASVVKWNFQQDIDNGWLQDTDKITSIDTPDDYTVVIHFTIYSNQYEFNWGWTTIFSQAAWEANAGDDKSDTSKGGIAWAANHIVGTGPFILQNYKQDVSMTWVKNPNYWQPGKPYLDGIEFDIIPDSTTASALLQAGDVDLWYQGSSALDWQNLSKKGFHVQNYWPGLPNMLLGNTTDPKSKWNDIRVREAMEYALDRDAMAKALGLGFWKASHQIAPDTEWGYIPDLQTRGYDPAMAKQLLADAGFPNGCPVTMLVWNVPPYPDMAQALAGYLNQAGFQVTLDLADPGRFFASVFGTGWSDLLLMFYGMDVNYLATYMSWFSSDPKSNLASFQRPDQLVALTKEAVLIQDAPAQIAETAKIMQYMYDNALLCPLWWVPATTVCQSYVHDEIYRHGFIRVDWENVYMDKH